MRFNSRFAIIVLVNVVALFHGGQISADSSVESKIKMSITRVDSSGFPNMTLYARILAADGSIVEGLTSKNFTISENSQPFDESEVRVQQLSDLLSARIKTPGAAGHGPQRDEGPPTAEAQGFRLNFAIVIDNSLSMDKGRAEKVISRFIQRFRERDRACIIIQGKKNEKPKLDALGRPVLNSKIWQRFVSSKEVLLRALADYHKTSRCPLYDSLIFAARQLAPLELKGRSAIILITDGNDSSSHYSLTQTIYQLSAADCPVFIFGVKPAILFVDWNPGHLREICRRTGGKYFPIEGDVDMGLVYNEIMKVLMGQYEITFKSKIVDPQIVLRQVTLVLRSDDDTVTTALNAKVDPSLIEREKKRLARTRIGEDKSDVETWRNEAEAALKSARGLLAKGDNADSDSDFGKAIDAYKAARDSCNLCLARCRSIADQDTSSLKASGDDSVVGNLLKLITEAKKRAAALSNDAAKCLIDVESKTNLSLLGKIARSPEDSLQRIRLDELESFMSQAARKIDDSLFAKLCRRYLAIVLPEAHDDVENGRYSSAEAKYEHILEVLESGDHPKPLEQSSEVYLGLGRSQLAQKKTAASIESLKTAVSLDSRNALAHAYLGKALRTAGDLEKAIVALRESLRLDGQNVFAHKELGELYYANKQYAESVDHLAAAVEQFSDVRTKFMLARSLQQEGKFPDAISWYQEVIAEEKSGPRAYLYLAEALLKRAEGDDIKRAIAHCQKAIALGGLERADLAMAHNTLGIALYESGSWDAGVKECLTAFELDPSLAKSHPIIRQ